MRFSKLVVVYIVLLSACSEIQNGGDAPGSGQTNAPSVGISTTDIKRIISTGESLSFNGQTGGTSDLALNPLTKLPAIAYYDKSATVSGQTAIGALKFAHMDTAGSWNIEVVDANYGAVACGTANSFCVGAPNVAAGTIGTIIKVAFKSDGTAAIAYVYGASANTVGGFKQVRFAERSATGNWTITAAASFTTAAAVTNVAVATIDPISAVTLTFDSQDRPWITYAFYAQTTTANSKTKLTFRSLQGAWSTTDIGTNVVGAGTVTTQATGNKQMGAAFCPSTGMLMVLTSQVDGAAAATGKPLFHRCTTLSDTTGCSAWENLVMSNGCAGATTCFSGSITTATVAHTRTDLTVAADEKILIGTYVTTTPNNTLVTAASGSACNATLGTLSTTTSWTAKAVGPGSNEGQNGFRYVASAANWYLSYLDSTTTVITNILASPFAGAWLSPGTAVETATVAGEGVGAAYDSTGDVYYTSYAAIPAGAGGAVGNDIKVASGLSTDIVVSGAQTFNVDTVDNTVNFFPTTAVPVLSAAKAPNGNVGYAFFYQDATAADSKLYYGIKGGTSFNPVFAAKTVVNNLEGAASPQFVGSYPSLAYDSASNPVIAYYNGVAANQALEVARSANGGSSFSISVVDETSANVGQYPSVAIYQNTIGIAYYDVTNDGLKYARFTPGKGWRRFSVDGIAGTGSCGNVSDNAGKYAKLLFTSTGRPVIAYQSNNSLKLAYATEAPDSITHAWSCLNLDASANIRGEGIDMVLSSSAALSIFHFDATVGAIRRVNCGSEIGTCMTTGTSAFATESIGSTGTLASVVTKPSAEITSTGKIYVSFYSASAQALVLASRATTDTAWTSEFIDASSSGASYISTAGMYGDLVLNGGELPSLFYRSNENWLKYFSREPNE
ncbi:MAG: esterase [Bdellovibrionia bacterium]